MKRTQKALSLALILCMLLGMALATVLTVFAETSTPATPPVTQWVNNEGKPLTTSSTGMGGKVDTFFSFGSYIRGNDTTCGTHWKDIPDRTQNPLKSNAAGDGCITNGFIYDSWPGHQMGLRFVAPFTGTVKMTFQLANSNASGDAAIVLANDATAVNSVGDRSGVLKEWKIVDHTDFSVALTYEFKVTANENYYLICCFKDGRQRAYFWINSLEYTSVELAGTATMMGHSISAMEIPVVNFYVKLDGSPMGVAANITVGDDAPIRVVGESYTGKGPDGQNFTAEDYVFVYSVPVSAKKMTETVRISLMKDGQELLTSGNTYSVAEYCYAQVKIWKDAGDAATRDQLDVAKICTGILVYGRTAQQYFGYNTANLPQIDADLLALVMADCQ